MVHPKALRYTACSYSRGSKLDGTNFFPPSPCLCQMAKPAIASTFGFSTSGRTATMSLFCQSAQWSRINWCQNMRTSSGYSWRWGCMTRPKRSSSKKAALQRVASAAWSEKRASLMGIFLMKDMRDSRRRWDHKVEARLGDGNEDCCLCMCVCVCLWCVTTTCVWGHGGKKKGGGQPFKELGKRWKKAS